MKPRRASKGGFAWRPAHFPRAALTSNTFVNICCTNSLTMRSDRTRRLRSALKLSIWYVFLSSCRRRRTSPHKQPTIYIGMLSNPLHKLPLDVVCVRTESGSRAHRRLHIRAEFAYMCAQVLWSLFDTSWRGKLCAGVSKSRLRLVVLFIKINRILYTPSIHIFISRQL